MASRKHTTEPAQLDLSFTPAEEWRDVPGYEGYYEVSSLGRVRSVERQVRSPIIAGGWQQLKSRILRTGSNKYCHVSLCKDGTTRTHQVHALVLKAFVGSRPPGLVANHIDGNKHNNKARNLEWVTYARNNQHAFERGLRRIGERHHDAKLTAKDVRDIRQMSEEGILHPSIAAYFHVSTSNIWQIIHRKSWKHLE